MAGTRQPRVGEGQAVFQWVTAAWRRRALRVLAAQNGTNMSRELEQAIDDRLRAHDIPVEE